MSSRRIGAALVAFSLAASACLYVVYARSFADSDADGVGDLPERPRRSGYVIALWPVA
jgi:hypothetical protein